MTPTYNYIIVGAGIAGIKAAEAIRKYDSDGSIILFNGEDRLPYKRTKISKNLYQGFQKEDFAIFTTNWYDAMQVDLISENVESVNPKLRILYDYHGNKYRWKKLIVCNGASPMLPVFKGSENKNIFLLRSAADAQKIREKAKEVEKIIVVGGGVLGIEIAEQLSKFGKNITIVHRDLLLLNKHFDIVLSQRLMSLLNKNGIQVIMNEEVESVLSVGNNKLFINVGGLIQIMADMIVFSVGVNPNISILKRSGININKGILVNEFLETSVENIYAAGDVAEHANGVISGLWHAAELQGIIAGSNAAEQKIPLPQKAFRLKLEVFDAYFFSMNIPDLTVEQDEIIVDSYEKYYRFFFQKGLLSGMLMANDKPMTKICEQAVRENWLKEKVIETFIEV